MKKTFQLISMFLALLTVALMLPISVVAETDTTSTLDDKVLIRLDNLFDVDATTTTMDYIVPATSNSNGKGQFQLYSTDQRGETIYAHQTYGNVGGGLWTELPHGAGHNYTIEFYMKNHVNDAPKFYYCGATDYNGVGCIYGETDVYSSNKNRTIPAVMANQNTWNGKIASIKNGRDAYSDNQGYIRYVIELEGWTTHVYVGGEKVGSRDVTTSATSNRYKYVSLIVAMTKEDGTADWTVGAPLLSVKDITVYQGCIADELNSTSRVEFTKDGEPLEPMTDVSTNTVLKETNFPSVTPAEGKAVKWFIKNTNKIVSAPYTVTNDLMLEAREVDLNGTEVVGMQYTESDGSTQSIRFLASLHSLDFSKAGFKIEAKYMETDSETQESVLKTKTWDVTSDIVYTAIEAEDDATGTVETVTANELGGTYLIAIAINDVPTTIGQIDFYVKAVVGESIESEQVTFTMNNGVSDKTLSLLETPSAN